MKIFRTILIILVVFVQYGYGQTDSDKDCKEMLYSYMEQMEALSVNKTNKIYHVKYTIQTEFSRELRIPSSKTTTEVFSGMNKIFVDDKKMKVFGNDKTVFVVLPDHKKIYWNDSDPEIFDNVNTYKQFLEIQRALLSSAKSVQCKKANELSIIDVIPSEEFSKRAKLLKQRITYNEKLKRIVKVDNLYNDINKIKRQIVEYKIVNFNSTKKINAPITYLFKDNKLREPYKGFEIIDNRKK